MIIMIAAIDNHHLLGKEGHLPWHCPQDIAHFHNCTRGKQLLMGKRTFDALPLSMKEERIYVLTHKPIEESDTIKRCEDSIALFMAWKHSTESLFVCGGAQVYEQAFPYVDEVWLSIIAGEYDGDTYLPPLDFSTFKDCHIERRIGFELRKYTHRIE